MTNGNRYSVEDDGEKMWLVVNECVRAEINTSQADVLARELIDASFRLRQQRHKSQKPSRTLVEMVEELNRRPVPG